MKMKIIYTALALLCATIAAPAQGQVADGRVTISDISVTSAGGNIEISIRMDAENTGLRRGEAVVLTPVITSGARRRELPSVVFAGRHRMRSDRRAERFGTRTIPYETGSAMTPAEVFYDESTEFEPWMAGAEVILEEDVYACAANRISGGSAKLALLKPAPVKPTDTPRVIYITPAAETVKNRNMSGSAFIDFPASRSTVLAGFGNNAHELDKIRRMIHDLRNDASVVINSVSLRGYSSPEGGYALNERLSQKRAEALRSYLQREHPYLNMLFVSSTAEDWDGLRLLVEESGLPGRNAILDVIDSGGDPDTRERKLKALDSYPELLGDYYPLLRRVEYRLDYTVRDFTVEESAAIIKTDPERLSLGEMFALANTYHVNSEEFEQVLDTAVRVYPNDPAACINYAAMLLERGRAADAHRYLDRYASHTEAWNNLGVTYMLEGDYPKARTYLERAEATPEVVYNLELLSRLEKYAQELSAADARQ